jgi:hypothetical protein
LWKVETQELKLGNFLKHSLLVRSEVKIVPRFIARRFQSQSAKVWREGIGFIVEDGRRVYTGCVLSRAFSQLDLDVEIAESIASGEETIQAVIFSDGCSKYF